MRIEILIFIITGLVIANIYTDGKYLKLALSWKKYYQMIGIAFLGYSLCWLMRKNPMRAKEMLISSNEYLKYLPVDKTTSSFISPILDFTSRQEFGRNMGGTMSQSGRNDIPQYSQSRIMNSGKTNKRSVSETKKNL